MRTILAGLFLCTALAMGAGHAQLKLQPIAEPITEEDVARGKALTEAGDCASCHTADPAKPFAGGKRIDTPFGGIYSANLTPDRETGLGAWSDDDFLRALRLGVGRDGTRYYPAFPYPHFTRLTRQDILAIRAHLATLTPVSSSQRAAELRFPFNWRFVMRRCKNPT
jgi:mono/diheme cytochrome c family protein